MLPIRSANKPLTSTSQLILLASIAFVLSSCASSSTREKIINEDAPTMSDIYGSAMGNQSSSAATPDPLDQKIVAYVNPSKSSETIVRELDADFPQIPNPELIMEVFPHLSEEGSPVPHYITVFRLFEKDHYALPGEVSIKDESFAHQTRQVK